MLLAWLRQTAKEESATGRAVVRTGVTIANAQHFDSRGSGIVLGRIFNADGILADAAAGTMAIAIALIIRFEHFR